MNDWQNLLVGLLFLGLLLGCFVCFFVAAVMELTMFAYVGVFGVIALLATLFLCIGSNEGEGIY